MAMVDETPTPPSQPARPLRATLTSRAGRLLRHALLFAIAVLIVDAVAGDKGFLALLQARRDYRALEISLAHARAENAALREQARRLREDPSAIEEEARRQLGLIKPGETLFILKDVDPAPKSK